ncbi:MAG: hypothetical protein KDB22_13805 [Planctomycetales bacterium]|nr:hypothetical protein [Planctomycetales bacterium]
MSILATITADEMRRQGLPPLDIRCSTKLVPLRFPEPQTPLYFHGPPGGPDFLYIQVIQSQPSSQQFSLDAEVYKHDLPGRHFELGPTGEFDLGGSKRPTRLWSIKYTPWLDSRASTFLEVPSASAIVLITFSAWMDANHNIVTRDMQRLILRTLTIKSNCVGSKQEE